MAQDTPIEWTDKSWNFLRGCSRVSEGCRNCYAERTAVRFAKPGEAYHGLVSSTPGGPRWTGKVEFFEHILLEPLKWRKPAKVFVNSMGDLFHEDVKDEWLDKAFAVMALTPQHTYQILTKRPERMRDYFAEKAKVWVDYGVSSAAEEIILNNFDLTHDQGNFKSHLKNAGWLWDDGTTVYDGKIPLQNVWLGVSCEDQKTADERIPLLLQTPAAVRWVSAEPLLGPIDFERHFKYTPDCKCLGGHDHDCTAQAELNWIVVGGESGPNARPFDIAWCRSIIEQCKAADVPVFVKQIGADPFYSALNEPNDQDEYFRTTFPGLIEFSGHGVATVKPILKSRKGGDMEEWPPDIRVREYPEVSA